jgi:hypothetical protein
VCVPAPFGGFRQIVQEEGAKLCGYHVPKVGVHGVRCGCFLSLGNQKYSLYLPGRTRLQYLQPIICMVSDQNDTFPERCACNKEELAHAYSHKYMPHYTLPGTYWTPSVTQCV